MSDNLMEKVNAFGERLKISGTEVGRKMSAGMSSMSFKMKELFQGQNPADRVVEEATSEAMEEPDWATNLEICDMVNTGKINSVDLIRGIKKRIMLKNPRVQYLALVLLETFVKNCEKGFSEVAAERVLDEMVKLIDDPQTVVNNRNKALVMIEAWGEALDELRYLPVYEETYKSLKSRGIRFPGRDNESLSPLFTPPRSAAAPDPNSYLPRQTQYDAPVQVLPRNKQKRHLMLLGTDDLTTTLVHQCHQSQRTVQRIIETAGDNEALLFEALNVNDEIQKALSKYDELKKPQTPRREPEPAMIPVAVEPEESPRAAKEDALIRKPAGSQARGREDDDIMHDLDEMIFGKKGPGTSDGQEPKKAQHRDDLINF
ncbi:hypothetical protein QJS10_CPA03g00332 [Acorus calamus]|uniref:TOM1-like protein 2 n=1 Tax=Acorus calamus TaxID=4465 RepID=A0AAV9F8Q3_ACOCL|nr:hypothetical protein QJS10_CPA03g00332 [Acorus calamus]